MVEMQILEVPVTECLTVAGAAFSPRCIAFKVVGAILTEGAFQFWSLHVLVCALHRFSLSPKTDRQTD